MRILFVASECAPLVKTGGLGDVVAALPRALTAQGAEVKVMLPAYRGITEHLAKTGKTTKIGSLYGGKASLIEGRAYGLDMVFLDAPHLYDRAGDPYTDAEGEDWPDNALRYGALSKAAADLAVNGLGDWKPDVVHAHDWQAGLTPVWLHFAGKTAPPSVLTIHNIAFQGLFPPAMVKTLGLPVEGYTPEGFEFFHQLGFLKGGIKYAQRVTTVSPTYARELMTSGFGMGLQGVLAARHADFSGILNGIDLDHWNPETDPLIAAPLASPVTKAKAANKRVLEGAFGLKPAPNRPLYCVISRLTWQKGLDLLLEALPTLLATGGRLVVLGSGEKALQTSFADAAKTHPDSVAVKIGYDEPLSHLMQAGADAIVVPSRFEPCGLTQLYGLRYGTLPIVARTGGLADTVIDANDAALKAGVATGIQFAPVTVAALADAIERAAALYADKTAWAKMVRRAMSHPVGWESSARQYMDLYQGLVGEREPD